VVSGKNTYLIFAQKGKTDYFPLLKFVDGRLRVIEQAPLVPDLSGK
jgi:hypothetical protein